MARIIEKGPVRKKKKNRVKIKPVVVYSVICALLSIGLVFTVLYRVGIFDEKVKRVKPQFDDYGISIAHDEIRFGEENTDIEESYELFSVGDFLLVFNSDYDVYKKNTLVHEYIKGTEGGFKLNDELLTLFNWLNKEENNSHTLYRIDTSRQVNKGLNETLVLGNYSQSATDVKSITVTDTAFILVYYEPTADGGYRIFDFSKAGTGAEFKTFLVELI